MRIFELNNAYQNLKYNCTSISIGRVDDTPHPYFEIEADMWYNYDEMDATGLIEAVISVMDITMHEVIKNACRHESSLLVECVIDNITGQSPLYYYNVYNDDIDAAVELWIENELTSEQAEEIYKILNQ